jgi:hypothetical protein
MTHHQHEFFRRRNLWRRFPERELEPIATYRLGDFIGNEGSGKGWEEFFHCGLFM